MRTTMDTITALMNGMANRGKPLKVFDWRRAAEIIRDERPDHVEAGLAEDWEWTGGVIFSDGKIVDDEYTYLASNWATPQILINGEYRDCYVMQGETDWGPKTKWPDDARAILRARCEGE